MGVGLTLVRSFGLVVARLDDDLGPFYKPGVFRIATTKTDEFKVSDIVCVRIGNELRWRSVAFLGGDAYPEYFSGGAWHLAPFTDLFTHEAYERRRPIRWRQVPKHCLFVDCEHNDLQDAGIVPMRDVVAKLINPEPGPSRPVAPPKCGWGPSVTIPASGSQIQIRLTNRAVAQLSPSQMILAPGTTALDGAILHLADQKGWVVGLEH